MNQKHYNTIGWELDGLEQKELSQAPKWAHQKP
jgi:hypothetical protein